MRVIHIPLLPAAVLLLSIPPETANSQDGICKFKDPQTHEITYGDCTELRKQGAAEDLEIDPNANVMNTNEPQVPEEAIKDASGSAFSLPNSDPNCATGPTPCARGAAVASDQAIAKGAPTGQRAAESAQIPDSLSANPTVQQPLDPQTLRPSPGRTDSDVFQTAPTVFNSGGAIATGGSTAAGGVIPPPPPAVPGP